MSFSKARIQRFNELTSEAPPPGSYDPKFDNKVKGFSIEKKERFQDSKSVTSSGGECNSSVSSKGARPMPSPMFRTPQLPKKRAPASTTASCPKAKTKLALGTSKELKYDVKDELADLKVECANKDQTIMDHARQIEEMKKETWRLEKELADLQAKSTLDEEQHKKDLESMAKLQQEILDCRDQKHLAEMENLRSQLLKMTETREREMALQKAAEEGIELRLAKICENSAMLQENIKQMEIDAQAEITRLTKKLAEVKSAKEREIEDMRNIVIDKEDELSMVRTELQQLKTVSDELRDQLTRLETDRENEILHLKNEEATLRAETIELGKTSDDLKFKLQTRQQVILELQSQLSTLQCEIDELRAENEKITNDSEMRMNEMLNQRDREIVDMRHEFIRERERLESEKLEETSRILKLEHENNELCENNAFLTEELQDVQKLYKETSLECHNVRKELKDMQNELDASDERHEEELKMSQEEMISMESQYCSQISRFEGLLENARLEYLRELDNMTEARNKELAELKFSTEKIVEEERRKMKERSDKLVENAEAVTRETLAACRAESEERVKRVISESEKKIEVMVRDARNALEEEMRESAERYATNLARIEVEKQALETKLNQRDSEIVKLAVALEEMKIVCENQESFSQSLQADLDRVEAELAERKAELRALKDQIRSEAAEMVARRRRFEVVMEENQASVAALSQRLSESDAEVERLQNELKNGEDSIHEHRGLLSAMRNTSKILSEEVYTLMERLDASKDQVDKIEAVNLAEIESVRSLFNSEIESLKLISAREMTRLQEMCKNKDEQTAELKKHLAAMTGKLDQAREMLLKMEELEDTRIIEISKLELDNERLAREVKIQTEAAMGSEALLEARENDTYLAINEAGKKLAEMTARMATLETDKIDKKEVRTMREELEARLSEEINRRQASEDEAKKLSEDCESLRKSYQEVSEKYAEMIGHHNHKQRVKHLNQLKDKIIRLEKDVETKKHVIDQQTRTIEKLKTDEKRTFNKGKENFHAHGISRSPYTTPASSPLKPLTPLRDRNE